MAEIHHALLEDKEAEDCLQHSEKEEEEEENSIIIREESEYDSSRWNALFFNFDLKKGGGSISLDDNSKIYIRFVQYINTIFASACTIYFLYRGLLNISFEYGQLAFVLAVLLSLDSRTKFNQRLWILYGVCISTVWAYAGMIDVEVHMAIENLVLSCFTQVIFLSSILYATIVINAIAVSEEYRAVEIDLLLYLVALNAICFFSKNDQFNNQLHMVLDLRLMVVLYNGLYQLKNKINLLKLKSFLLLIILIMVGFLIITTINPLTDLLFSSIYGMIGLIIYYDAYYTKERYRIKSCLPI